MSQQSGLVFLLATPAGWAALDADQLARALARTSQLMPMNTAMAMTPDAPSRALPCAFGPGSMAVERLPAREQVNPGALPDASMTWLSSRSNHVPDFKEATILAET
jgi:hypothetical protein